MDRVSKTDLCKVAVVGRPNVGKSTIFNRLVGGRQAIVDKSPGVTRDRKYGRVEWCGNEFILIDTGGLEFIADPDDLKTKVRTQIEMAVSEGAVILFVVDFKDGVIPPDLEIARFLRRSKKRTIQVVNKVDDPGLLQDPGAVSSFSLGFGDPIPISAIHGLGVDRLLDELRGIPSRPQEEETRVAIVGRPNVGKSSLLNTILGEERVIVDSRPGTTRDSIDTVFYRDGERYLFIDTAGIRKKGKIKDLERFSVKRAIESLQKSHLVLLLVEATSGVTRQDKKILQMMESSGCGGIIVANKWDLASGGSKEEYRAWILKEIPFLQYFPVAFTSALSGEGVGELLDLLKGLISSHSKRITTGVLNRALSRILARHRPPPYKGKEAKIYYATQHGIRPPSFILFVNYPRGISSSYLRYLEGGLRESFGLLGTPIRFEVRTKGAKDV